MVMFSSLKRREIDFTEPEYKEVIIQHLDEPNLPDRFGKNAPEFYKLWQYNNIWCLIYKGPLRNYNGYVYLPDNHSWRGLDYDSEELDSVSIHGGLTFSQDNWIGFDTAHAYDIWENKSIYDDTLNIGSTTNFYLNNNHNWSFDLLEEEIKRLAQQVIEAYV